jgi:hypothetical protein
MDNIYMLSYDELLLISIAVDMLISCIASNFKFIDSRLPLRKEKKNSQGTSW